MVITRRLMVLAGALAMLLAAAVPVLAQEQEADQSQPTESPPGSSGGGDGSADSGSGGSGSSGSDSKSGGGSSGGSLKVLPNTGGATVPMVGVVGALLVGSGLLVRRIIR